MNWTERIENYRRESGFPVSMAIGEDGRMFGTFTLGNDYRSKQGYHGEYPPNYLRRMKALFPDKNAVLHLFSGKVDTVAMPGDTVDLNPDLHPTWLDDAQTLVKVPLEYYDLIMCDPPYTSEDADHYGTTMVKRGKVMKALTRCLPGTHLAVLDQAWWMYDKTLWEFEAEIGMRRSTNHRFRVVTIWRRL